MRRSLLMLLAVLALGCDSEAAPEDGSVGGRPDAGPGTDAGTGSDAGFDAGPPPTPNAPGCGSDGETGAWQQTISVPGVGDRSFFISVPSGYDSSRPHRLFYAVHGTGWTGEMIRPYYDIENVPGGDAHEIYVYPDRDPSTSNLETTGAQATADLQYFDAVHAWVDERYCIDSDRVFAMGHSGGGNWVTFLSCHRGDVLRAVAPTGTGGAWWYDGLRPGDVSGCRGPVPAMVVHGRTDAIIAYDPWGLEALDYFRTLNGCAEGNGEMLEGTSCAAMNGCDETYDCSHDEPTPWGDGHQIPSWHRQEVMRWMRSF